MSKTLRVLMVEDSPIDAELVFLNLQNADFKADWQRVQNEREYLAALETLPDLILADWNLPQFSGLRALQLMKERNLDIPFVIVSGSIGEEMAIDALRQGASDYVLKDRPARLAQAAQRALAEKQSRQERMRAELALRESEERYRTLAEAAQDLIFIVNRKGRFDYVNEFAAHMFQRPVKNIVGGTPDDFFTKEESVRQGENLKKVFESAKPLYFESQTSFSSQDLWLGTRLSPIKNEAGEIVSVLGISRDITERKQAEAKLALQAEELRQRNEELARLYRASGSLISGAVLDLQELAREIVEVLQREFGQANSSLFVVRQDSDQLERLAVAGPYADQVKNQSLSVGGKGFVPRSIRTGQVVNVGDVHSREDYVIGWDLAQSEMTIPLKIGSEVIGAIDVQSSEPNAFSPDDERLMTVFAEQAAQALEHSRLNGQTEDRLQQLTSLRTVDMAISGSFDLNLTLGILLDQLMGQLGVHAADVLVFDSATQTFRLACERGFHTQMLHNTQLKFGAGYAWRAVRERRVIDIPDMQAGPDGLQRAPDLSAEQFVAYRGLPLIAKGEIQGVLEIFHRASLVLDKEWNDFLEMLAGQAAIAINNAELFNRLQSSNADLTMAYDTTLEGWASALELRDKETEGHTRRVTEATMQLARAMGVKETDLVHIYRGAVLHDIGKMGVPDSIVLKPGPLTDEEWVIMRKHPQYAHDMLAPIAFLRHALDIPYCHHEKWDGTGYPRGLKGVQIPIAARIFSVIDVWDALSSDRPYRDAWPEKKVRQYIQEQEGQYFDPQVVRVFLSESISR